jgi:micrococcal nuclease
VTLSVAGIGVALSGNTALAALPAAMVERTAKAACLFAAKQAVVGHVVTAEVIALANEMLSGKFLTGLKLLMMAVATACLVGAGLLAHPAVKGEPEAKAPLRAERKAGRVPKGDPRVAGDFADTPAYKVVRVIDGRTVVVFLNGQATAIRLIGVDAPATTHPDKTVERLGKEAGQFLSQMLENRSVYLKYDQLKIGQDGFTRAYLYRASDGLFINLEILSQGYGQVDAQVPFGHMGLFRERVRAAREGGKGMWAAD